VTRGEIRKRLRAMFLRCVDGGLHHEVKTTMKVREGSDVHARITVYGRDSSGHWAMIGRREVHESTRPARSFYDLVKSLRRALDDYHREPRRKRHIIDDIGKGYYDEVAA